LAILIVVSLLGGGFIIHLPNILFINPPILHIVYFVQTKFERIHKNWGEEMMAYVPQQQLASLIFGPNFMCGNKIDRIKDK
jgi:hypothetical protein